MKRLLASLAVLLLGVGVLAGCGDDDDDPTVGGPDETTTTTEAPAEQTTTSEPSEAETSVGQLALAATDNELGALLAIEGMTVYLFTVDPADGASACADDCAGAWPPVFVGDGIVAGDGVDDALIGSAPRDDGPSDQLTYNGHRLYFYSGDAAPGDVNGQGVGDVWFAVTPAGEQLA